MFRLLKSCSLVGLPGRRTATIKPNYFISRRHFEEQNKNQNQNQNRESEYSRPETRSRLRDKMMGPPTENAYGMGKGALAGAAAVGIAALCYYGIGIGKQGNIYQNAKLWPPYVRQRIRATYMYFGSSCALTALSAFFASQSPAILEFTTRQGWMSVLGTMALVMGSGILTQSLPYGPGITIKDLAWAAHCGILGVVIAPMCYLGGPILTRAALYTAGVVGGLSAVAACAPNDKFLYMAGPLAVGMGAIFAASLAQMWLPPTTAIGAGLNSLTLYGGLILFSCFLLFDTQRIIMLAERWPQNAQRPYDPINASLALYMDTLNIFIRIAAILAGAGDNSSNKKKKR